MILTWKTNLFYIEYLWKRSGWLLCCLSCRRCAFQTSYLSGRLSLPFFNVPFLKEVKFLWINGFRLIKEFDRKIKDEEGRNSPEVNKQLNDEKQSMVSTQNTYFQFFLAHVENTVSNSSKFELTFQLNLFFMRLY